MPKKSAGLVLYRVRKNSLEVMLIHPGGPFWAKKDDGAWSIPKGEFQDDEQPLTAAIREFEEETGHSVSGDFLQLSPVKQSGGKTVYPFALKQDFDTSKLMSNLFSMEWPPKSGKQVSFPEVDKAAWFDLETGCKKINKYQVPILQELEKKVRYEV
jgi:predicted NUDIX family NTP pyrophosphohydrolase